MSTKNRTFTGAPTNIDLAKSVVFANEQISRIKCRDRDILKSICNKFTERSDCDAYKDLEWNQESSDKGVWTMPYYSPDSSEKCETDPSSGGSKLIDGKCGCMTNEDCLGTDKIVAQRSPFCIAVKCQFKSVSDQDFINVTDTSTNPIDICGNKINIFDFQYGMCKIASKELCNNSSKLPYKESGCSEEKRLTGECRVNPSAVVPTSCKNPDDDDDKDKDPCKGIDTSTYLEWDSQTNSCIMGNHALKKYCEYPATRLGCAKCPTEGQENCNSTTCDISDCGEDGRDKLGRIGGGVVDVPSFYYTDNGKNLGSKTTGSCFMTPDYCFRFNTRPSKKWAECAYQKTKQDCESLIDKRVSSNNNNKCLWNEEIETCKGRLIQKSEECTPDTTKEAMGLAGGCEISDEEYECSETDQDNDYDEDKPTQSGVCVESLLNKDESGNPKRYRVDVNSACNISDAQKIAQFFVGKTLLAELSSGTKCARDDSEYNKESYATPGVMKTTLTEIFRKFNSYPDKTTMDLSHKDMESKQVLFPNFAGNGVNLYLIKYKSGIETQGFLYDEVKMVYPTICKKNKKLEITRDDVKNSKTAKKLYLFENSKDLINTTISDFSKKK